MALAAEDGIGSSGWQWMAVAAEDGSGWQWMAVAAEDGSGWHWQQRMAVDGSGSRGWQWQQRMFCGYCSGMHRVGQTLPQRIRPYVW